MLYGAVIWAHRYLENLEKIQLSFFKKIFYLPKCTPGYALRMELGLPPIIISVFSATLNFLAKIHVMNESRYLKLCFNRLQALSINNKLPKYNWFLQIERYFVEIGARDILKDLHMLSSNRIDLINRLSTNLKNLDIERTCRSTFMQLLPTLPIDG